MPSEADIEREMLDRSDEWLGILRELIGIPSGDPPGDTTEAASYVAGLLEDHGIDHEVIAPKEDRPNVVGHFEGAVDGPQLTFNGHLDTFFVPNPDAWEHDPYGGEVDDGNIYGRGVADMLAGLTASIGAFLYLAEHREQIHGSVTLAAVSDEESGGRWGAEYLVENHPEYNGDAVINGEPAHPDLVCFGEYGNAWLDVRATGVSTPTSFAGGTNANDALIDFLAEARRVGGREFDIPEWIIDLVEDAKGTIPADADRICEDGSTEQYRHGAARVGTLSGGEKVNLRAAEARAEMDLRTPVGVDVDAVVDEIQGLADEDPAIDVDVFQQTASTYSDPDDEIFDAVSTGVERVRGTSPAFTYTYSFSDVRYYRQAGVPGVWYGPTPYNVGRTDEHVPLDEFEEVAAVHALAGARYLGLVG